MFTLDLSGRNGVILGVANHRSLAWAIARQLSQAGARLAFTYVGDRVKEKVESLASELPGSFVTSCDVSRDEDITRAFSEIGKQFDGRLDYVVHSVAFAKKEELEGEFLDTSRDGFHLAMDISAYSMVRVAREAVPLMKEGGAMLALTYNASQRVMPSYNVMGSAKAALEHEVRQLAFELGPKRIRVNAISAGPVNTLSARGVSGFMGMLQASREKAPLKRAIEPEEVGKSALYLLSDMSSGTTGEIHYVDAGYNIMGT